MSHPAVGQLGGVEDVITVVICDIDAHIPISPQEGIVDTSVELRQGVAYYGFIVLRYLIVLAAVDVLEFPVTRFNIFFIPGIWNTVFQGIFIGCRIVIEVGNIIYAVRDIAVELS